MATHSSILAWRILWAEEHGRLKSRGSQRVRHERSNLAHTAEIMILKVWDWWKLQGEDFEEGDLKNFRVQTVDAFNRKVCGSLRRML